MAEGAAKAKRRAGIGRLATLPTIAVVMAALALWVTSASAGQRDPQRCAPTAHAKVVAETRQLVVTSAPHTEHADGLPVTDPRYSTCLRRTGARQVLFTGSSNPSPDAGNRSFIAAIRAAGEYVLYVHAFTQNSPEGPGTETATFRLVDVANHDRLALSLPDPNISLIGPGEIAVSVDGYRAWAQVNTQAGATTETVEADTGTGPTTLATKAIPATLRPLAFHKLAFHGETLSWLDEGRRMTEALAAR